MLLWVVHVPCNCTINQYWINTSIVLSPLLLVHRGRGRQQHYVVVCQLLVLILITFSAAAQRKNILNFVQPSTIPIGIDDPSVQMTAFVLIYLMEPA